MKPQVSIVVPVYNEVGRLLDGFTQITSFLAKQSFSWELIIVDDGSVWSAESVLLDTKTRSKVQRFKKSKQLIFIQLDHNQGKGAAIAKGVAVAQGKEILFTDIDCSVPISFLSSCMVALQKHDVVIASRRVKGAEILVHQKGLREWAGRIYTLLANTVCELHVADATCGFKLFKADVAKDIFSQSHIHRWSFDTEVLFLVRKFGYSLQEIPVVWSNKEGSRVKPLDSLYSFADLVSIRIYDILGKYKTSAMKRSSIPKNDAANSKYMKCDLCSSTYFQFLFDHHNNWTVRACNSCGLNQVIPRPSRSEVAALYANDASHFTPYIHQELVHRAYFHKKLSNLILQVPSKKKLHLLDVGCLTGVLLEEAIKLGINATGIDISSDAVGYCKSRGLSTFHGTIEHYSKKFPSKKFDIITAMEVIEHEYSPRLLVQTMHTMLRPGGIAVVTTPNHGSIWRKVMGKYWPGYQHIEHLYFFDHASLQTLFEREGFSSVEVKRDENRPFPLSFLFTRAADYAPIVGPVLRLIGAILKPFPIQNPINPWDDAIVVARKV